MIGRGRVNYDIHIATRPSREFYPLKADETLGWLHCAASVCACWQRHIDLHDFCAGATARVDELTI